MRRIHFDVSESDWFDLSHNLSVKLAPNVLMHRSEQIMRALLKTLCQRVLYLKYTADQRADKIQQSLEHLGGNYEFIALSKDLVQGHRPCTGFYPYRTTDGSASQPSKFQGMFLLNPTYYSMPRHTLTVCVQNTHLQASNPWISASKSQRFVL